MSRDRSERRNPWAVLQAEEVYTALVKENPPRSRSGSRGTAGFGKGWMRFFLTRGSRRSKTSPYASESVRTCAISGRRRNTGETWAACRSAVSLTYSSPPRGPIGSKAHSNPSWLERYDAAVLQRVDQLGQVREQRSRQCIRLPAALAAKLDDRRLSRRMYRKQRSEITIRGHDDSMLGGSALEDHIIVGVLLLLSERGLHHDRPVVCPSATRATTVATR